MIEPLLDDPLIEFIGEIGDAEKPAFLGGARALLFPIDWPEPFGLVMIEAMAAGHTGRSPGAADRPPEVIEHGPQRLLVESIDEAVAAVAAAASLTAPRCAPPSRNASPPSAWPRDYLELYRSLHCGNVRLPYSEDRDRRRLRPE